MSDSEQNTSRYVKSQPMSERAAKCSLLRLSYLQLTKESQTLYEEVKRKQDLVKQLEEEIGTASQQLEEVNLQNDL
jgi:hypothetical protein